MKTLNDIKKIAVLGAGTMGPGIAQRFAMGGFQVTIYTRSGATMEKAKATLENNCATFVKENVLTRAQADKVLALVRFTQSVEEAVTGAQIVMETIVENRDAKTALYTQLDGMLPEDVIIASNTSALNIFEILPERRLPMSVIAHWYSPAQLIPLVEVCPCRQTEAWIPELISALLKQCGKSPVTMKKFINGYIVNRLQMCLNQEIFYLLDNGYCSPEDIDTAVKASFIPRAMVLGVVKRMDFGGLDMTANNFKNRSYTMPPETDMPATLAAHIEKGELGVKTGRGFYDYTDVDMSELIAKRDRQLFEAFRVQAGMMDDPV